MGTLAALVLLGGDLEYLLDVRSLVWVRTDALVNESAQVDGVDVCRNRGIVAVGYLLTQRVQVHLVPVERTVQSRHLHTTQQTHITHQRKPSVCLPKFSNYHFLVGAF